VAGVPSVLPPGWFLAFFLAAFSVGASEQVPGSDAGAGGRSESGEAAGRSAADAPAPVDAVPAVSEPSATASLPKPPRSPAASRAEVDLLITRIAPRYRLDLDLVHALIRAESAYDPHAVSHAGAVGLMQVMPATAADYGVHSVETLFEPQTNLNTGMRHLRRLLDKYGAIGHAVMAYNAGEGALERSGGFVTYAETQRYTHDVIVAYLRKKGVEPYTPQARNVVGIEVTPAMAQAAGRGGDGTALGQVDAVAPPARAPVTRLTSRLSPRLSKPSDAPVTGVRTLRSAEPARSGISDHRSRLTVDAR
jgi:hypothetical protein